MPAGGNHPRPRGRPFGVNPAAGRRWHRWAAANAGRSGDPACPAAPANAGRNGRPGAADLSGPLRAAFIAQAARRSAEIALRTGDVGAAGLVGAARTRARRIRRRRACGAGAAVVLIGAAGVVAALRPPLTAPGPTAAPPVAAGWATPPMSLTARPAPFVPEIEHGAAGGAAPVRARPAPPVDVVGAGRLLTTTGRSVDVSKVGAVYQASKVDDGWLIVAGEHDSTARSLWRIQPSGRQVALVAQVGALVLAVDGRRVAWRDAGDLVVARIARGVLVAHRRTPIPRAATPVGLVGDGALLARTGSDGQIDAYDVWWPARGRFTPTWISDLASVYGVLPDGRTLVAARERPSWRPRVSRDANPDGGFTAAVASGACLVLLDAGEAFRQRTGVCGLGLATGRPGRVSPDGRWLLAQSVAGSAVLVDLAEVASGRDGVVPVGPGPLGEPVWLDDRTVVYGPAAGILVRLRIPPEGAAAATTDTLAVPDLPAAPELVVP